MSSLDVPVLVERAGVRRKAIRPATVIAALVPAVALLLIAHYVIDAGYVRRDIVALQAGEAWRSGGWMSQVVLRAVSLVPGATAQQAVLSLIAAASSGLVFGALYSRLRANGWFVVGAFAVLLMLGLNAGTLYTFTASSRGIPLYVAFAALIPAVRSLEDVGDVQSAIGLGLLMPLLLLASPVTTPLIIPFAIGAALADGDGRRDPRAFVAMLLVAVLPTVIVAIGILGFLAQAGMNVGEALLPYVSTYTQVELGDIGESLLSLAVFAPVMVVPIAYCFWQGLGERRRVLSALAVVALPVYLALARVTLNTTMTAIVPPLALIAAFVSWLAVVRLPLHLRVLSLAMLAIAAILSWTQTGLWDDAVWKAALLHVLPTDLSNLQLRPGV